jgi:hypothetical protein
MSSGTAFRVHIRVLCIYPKNKISSVLTKNAEKQDMNDFDRSGSIRWVVGRWSHDQLPKMVEIPKL